MSGRPDFEHAAADHSAAIEDLVRAVEAVDPAAWSLARQPGKWSPAEIAQHLILSYDPPLAELAGGAGFVVRLPWWKRTFLRWKVLPQIMAGNFPKGAPAPREARPRGGPPSPQDAALRLRESSARFQARLSEAQALRRVRLTHSYFGKIEGPQILKLMAVHARHHRDQLACDIVGASASRKGDTSS
jgi:hypothetical protein